MSRKADIERLIEAAIQQGFVVRDLANKWMVLGKDGVSQQLIHKPHGRSGDPSKIRSQLRRLGVRV